MELGNDANFIDSMEDNLSNSRTRVVHKQGVIIYLTGNEVIELEFQSNVSTIESNKTSYYRTVVNRDIIKMLILIVMMDWKCHLTLDTPLYLTYLYMRERM